MKMLGLSKRSCMLFVAVTALGAPLAALAGDISAAQVATLIKQNSEVLGELKQIHKLLEQ